MTPEKETTPTQKGLSELDARLAVLRSNVPLTEQQREQLEVLRRLHPEPDTTKENER